jgi:hypothetical protein
MPNPVIPHRRARDRIARLALAGCLATSLTACGGGDPSKTVESLDSWTSTVRTASNAVHLGWVPRRYGAQIRDRAVAALNQAREQREQEASAEEARAMHDAEDRLAGAVDSLSRTVGS